MKKYFLSSVILFCLLAYFAFAVPAVNLVSPTLSANATAFLNWTYINLTSSENLTQALLEWGNTTGFGNFSNVSMANSSGGNLTWWVNMTNLIDGTYNYTIWAKNSSGNWSQSERRFVIIDTVAPYNISACQNLTIENGSYVLAQNVSSAGTCFTISANNITLDGAGYIINYSQSAMGYAINNTGHNYTAIKNTAILQENASVGNSHAIYLENASNSAITNNNITSSSISGHGIYIRASVNTAVSGGSVISKSGYEYYLQDAGASNNFTNTNFTASRNISFADSTSWFNYNNGSGNIWLKTNVSAPTNVSRTLINWNNYSMGWNDTNSSANIIANYNITGLIPGTNYYVINASAGAKTRQIIATDATGTLASFAINLNGNTEMQVSSSNISSCHGLNVGGATYTLAADVSAAGTCFTVEADNITIDGRGHTINYSQSTPGYAINNSLGYDNITIKNLNIVQENSSVSGAHAIYFNNGANNGIMSNNTITTSGGNGYGIYLNSSGTNNITGGSIISQSSYDYYLQNISTTNNFTNTNFTAARKIYFYDTTSYFNYNNGSAQNIWLKTNVSAQGNITRTLINWNNTLMQWNDTNSTTGLIANYIIAGLQATGTYKVYNTSAGVRTNSYALTPDSAGTLPSFQIALGSNTEIIVNYSAPYIAPATCSDGIKNQDETGIDCGGSCSACVSGGGGGNETSSIKTITQTGIEPLKKVSVSFKTSLNSPYIKMEKLSETPVRVPVDTVYQYLNITKVNFNNSDIENATIEFKVSKAWINASGLSRMYLARYNEGWVKLRTDLTDSSGDFNTYLAYTDGFSYFAIAGEPAGQAAQNGANNNAVVPIAENNSTNNQSAAHGEQNTTAIKKDAASGLTWLLIIVAAIIFTCIYAYISYGGNKKPVPENIIGEKQKSDSVESAPPSKNSEETEEIAPGTAFSDIYEEAETDYLSKRIQEARRKLKSD